MKKSVDPIKSPDILRKMSEEQEQESIAVTIRFEPDQIARLDELAKRTFRKRPDLIRLAVQQILNADNCEKGKESGR